MDNHFLSLGVGERGSGRPKGWKEARLDTRLRAWGNQVWGLSGSPSWWVGLERSQQGVLVGKHREEQ